MSNLYPSLNQWACLVGGNGNERILKKSNSVVWLRNPIRLAFPLERPIPLNDGIGIPPKVGWNNLSIPPWLSVSPKCQPSCYHSPSSTTKSQPHPSPTTPVHRRNTTPSPEVLRARSPLRQGGIRVFEDEQDDDAHLRHWWTRRFMAASFSSSSSAFRFTLFFLLLAAIATFGHCLLNECVIQASKNIVTHWTLLIFS